jgi:hypothetical protein
MDGGESQSSGVEIAVGGFTVYYMTQRTLRFPISSVMFMHKDIFTFLHGFCNVEFENVI